MTDSVGLGILLPGDGTLSRCSDKGASGNRFGVRGSTAGFLGFLFAALRGCRREGGAEMASRCSHRYVVDYSGREVPLILRRNCEDVPHRSTEDDIYNGYFIPAGTLVVANTWYVL